MDKCSLWFCIITPTLAICVISLDSMDLLSITSISHFYFNSCSGIWWWWAKSWSKNTMPVAPQSVSAYVGISWIFTVNVQVIIECFPSIDPSNTSTLLTERFEIPKHFKAYKTNHFPSIKMPSIFHWPNLFLIPWSLTQFLLPWLLLQPP